MKYRQDLRLGLRKWGGRDANGMYGVKLLLFGSKVWKKRRTFVYIQIWHKREGEMAALRENSTEGQMEDRRGSKPYVQ